MLIGDKIPDDDGNWYSILVLLIALHFERARCVSVCVCLVHDAPVRVRIYGIL